MSDEEKPPEQPAAPAAPPTPPAPEAQLQADLDAASTPEAIKAFMDEQTANREKQEKPFEVKPDDRFDTPALQDTIPPSTAEVPELSMELKQAYLIAMLNDTRFEWNMASMGGRLNVTCRSRTLAEQELIMDMIAAYTHKMEKDPDKEEIVAQTVHHFQSISLLLIISRVNDVGWGIGDHVSKLLTDGDKDGAMTALEEAAKDKLAHLNNIKWNALMKSISDFEAICAKLHSMAGQESFWPPLDSVASL